MKGNQDRRQIRRATIIVRTINGAQKLQQEDDLLVAETYEIHHECMDEVREISIGKVVSPLKEQDKSLVTT